MSGLSWTLFKSGIKSSKYDGNFSFNILQKWQNFTDSNLNYWYSFFDDIPLIAITGQEFLKLGHKWLLTSTDSPTDLW